MRLEVSSCLVIAPFQVRNARNYLKIGSNIKMERKFSRQLVRDK